MISNITETTASQVKDLVWYTRSPLLYYELLSPKGRYFLLVIFSFFFSFFASFWGPEPTHHNPTVRIRTKNPSILREIC